MKPAILFLEQQSWRAGAQRVLEYVLDAVQENFAPIVAFPDDGPFAVELRQRGVETLTYHLGRYRAGEKTTGEKLEFGARSLSCAVDLARIVIQKRVRLVYINGPRCLPAGVMAARLTRRPSLFHLHRTLTRKSELWVAARFGVLAARIVSCSQTSADALLAENPKLAASTQVVYNPAKPLKEIQRKHCENSPLPTGFPESGHPIIGLVGRLTPGKGVHVLIEAVAQLRTCWPGIQTVIVGAPDAENPQDASYVRRLRARAGELGLDGQIRWAGYRSDLGPYYTRFDALALPSTDCGDGVPMVALEATQWGIPIVASRAGGIPEVVRDGVNGLLVPPGSARALAAGLARVIGDPQLRAKLKPHTRDGLDDRFSPVVFRQAIHEVVSRLALGSYVRAGNASDREIVAKT